MGQTTWFAPEGCSGLTLNSYHCTAEGLTPDTSYVFRVKTSCIDPLSSSPYSATSLPVSTLADVPTWEASQRRVLSVSMTANIDYNEVQADPALQESLVSNIITATAARMNVDPSRVRVEVLAGSSLAGSGARRLSALSTVFSVLVDGVSEDTQAAEVSVNVAQEVSSVVQAETGTASEVQVASASSLAAAIPPERITWSQMSSDQVQLTWNPRPLNDCSFLAWQVSAHAGNAQFAPAGCTSLVDLSTTSCVASGFAPGSTYTFSVSVLCADPAASSEASEASEAWTLVSMPRLLSAELTAGFTTLLLTFDAVVNAAQLIPSSCASAFDEAFRPKLGSDFVCSLTGTQMAITMGSGATLVMGESVSLQTAAGSVALTSSSPIVEISGFLSASPPAVQPCNPVTLLLQATGSAGRPLQVEWLSDTTSPELQTLLAAATASSSSSVELAPAVLTSVLSAAPGQSGQSFDFQVSVRLANWLGHNVVMNTSVTLLSSGVTTPSITASGEAAVSKAMDEDVELEVQTEIVAPCDQSGSAEAEASLVTTWLYRSTSSWMTLAHAGLVDVSPLPNRLRVAAFSLLPGTHEFRATATLPSGEADSVTFQVTVDELPAPTLVVTGPRTVGLGCDLQLGSSVSGVVHPLATVAYSWSCLQPSDCNSTLSNFASGTASSQAQLSVSGAELAAGSYSFRL